MSTEREYAWDDTIEKDGGEFIVLPNGDYNFTVTKFERGRFNGSDKMPACNQAKIELTVHSDQGDVVIYHNLFLHSKTEGLLSNFFAGIGQKRKGEKLKMNWNAVVGAKGRAKIEINRFTGKDGEARTNNQVKTFYDAGEINNLQPSQHQPPFSTGSQPGGQTGTFVPGQF
jgi:hypothetical protein